MKPSYIDIECVDCYKRTKYEQGEDNCGEYWDLRNKQGWELIYSHGGISGRCNDCVNNTNGIQRLIRIITSGRLFNG